MSFTEQQVTAFADTIVPAFYEAGDALTKALGVLGVSTSTRHMLSNDEFAIGQYVALGATILELHQEAQDADTVQELFGVIANNIAHLILTSRRMGVDIMPLVANSLSVNATVFANGIDTNEDGDVIDLSLRVLHEEHVETTSRMLETYIHLPERVYYHEALLIGLGVEDDEEGESEESEDEESEEEENDWLGQESGTEQPE